jgi:hypothetical protein
MVLTIFKQLDSRLAAARKAFRDFRYNISNSAIPEQIKIGAYGGRRSSERLLWRKATPAYIQKIVSNLVQREDVKKCDVRRRPRCCGRW